MRIWKIVAIAALMIAVIVIVGCGKAEQKGQDKAQEQTSTMAMQATDHTPAGEEIGTTATCPIDGMEITVADTTPSAMYDGKTYYFCNAQQKADFMADPAKILANAPGMTKMEGDSTATEPMKGEEGH